MHNKGKTFSDKWILIIGIPVIGITFPFLFGSRFGDSEFFIWMFISLITTLLSWLFTRQIVSVIWEKFPWEKSPVLHILSALLMIFVFTFFSSGIVYFLSKYLLHRGPGYWQAMRPVRIGILILISILQFLHETILLFYKWKKELTRAADLEKENLRSKFDALKNHINPHFLFNSLGTLASLIRTDPLKAEKYVNEFSGIYRYFLEVNSNELVTLKEEMAFLKSYVFLQQIRFGDGFIYDNSVDKKYYSTFILPLTLELLVENALKHNTMQAASPLKIEVFTDETRNILTVRNNYQPRQTIETTGTGLSNLEQRYHSFLGRSIYHFIDNNYFVVEIPLISNEG